MSKRLHCVAFDGRGFILKGFVTKFVSGTTAQHFATLFYQNQGIIKNITIKDFTIGGNFDGERRHGFLVYYNTSNAELTLNGLITNCISYGNITEESEYILATGVFAYDSRIDSTITNCTNNMNIFLNGEGLSYTGGITNNAYGTTNILNNTNYGNLHANNRAGGIVSYTNSTTSATIQNNINYGSIDTTNREGSSYAGGIVGNLLVSAKPTIENNTNYGLITSNSSTYPACGIASGPEENTVFTHSGNRNYGTLKNTSTGGTNQLFYGDIGNDWLKQNVAEGYWYDQP